MGRVFDGIYSFLKEHFETDGLESDSDSTIGFRLEDEAGHEWGCLVVAEEEAEQVVFYSVLLQRASVERRTEVMRFITLANYGMQVGNFELDLDDGEVRFKTSIDIEGIELSPGLCRNLVELNLMMMGVYFDAICAVIAGTLSAADAIEAAERDDDES